MLVLGFMLLVATSTSGYPYVQDTRLTPGLVDQSIKFAELCPHANTRARRAVTPAMKRRVFDLYRSAHDVVWVSGVFEVDHLVPLELGGMNGIGNLWPEPFELYTTVNGRRIRVGAHEKDLVENELHRRVCAKEISLGEAQTISRTDWLSYYLSRRGSISGR